MQTSFHGKRVLLIALLLATLATGCVGPFNATRRVHTWNREIENRWVGEGVFLVFRAAFVYSVAAVGDLLIFNSCDFWGFENPIDPPSRERIDQLNAADDARAAAARAEDEAEEAADAAEDAEAAES